MRIFTNLEEAASEIKRDIYKSPVIPVNRVQNLYIEDSGVHEALDYSYSVIEMPKNINQLVKLGVDLGFWGQNEVIEIEHWLSNELPSRLNWLPKYITELLHPHLNKLQKNSEPDYTYTDRLRNSLEVISKPIINDLFTRRSFWPIFQIEDSIRSSRMVRIPCSIGYQALVRPVGDILCLHVTYMQRSCDFNKFWLTDIWLARQWQLQLIERIRSSTNFDLKCGNTTHFITSLHAFIDDEVY